MMYAISGAILARSLALALSLWKARSSIWPGLVTALAVGVFVGLGAFHDRAYYALAFVALLGWNTRWGGLWRWRR